MIKMLANLLGLTRKIPEDDLLRQSPGLPGLQEKVASFRKYSWPPIPLDTGKFIVFDTETTGLSFKGDEIISIGAVLIENGQIIDEFHEFVNPQREIPERITELTGINNDMVAASSDILTVLDKFLEFKGITPLIAHNASFDLSFINIKLKRYCGHRLTTPTIDTFLLSHLLFPLEECHSLDCLAQTYNINTDGRHTALGDAIITSLIYTKMAGKLVSTGIKTTHHLANYLQFRRLI